MPLRVYFLGYPTNLVTFHSKRALLWRFDVAGLLAKYPIFLRDFNLIRIFSTNFHKSPQYKILRKSIHWEPRTDTDGLTDGRDEVDRYFRKYAKERNKLVNLFHLPTLIHNSFIH